MNPDWSPVLLGGVGGAVTAFLLQTLRDGFAMRRRIRSASSVLRMEVVGNGAIVQSVVDGHRPPTVGVAQLLRHAFDGLIPDIAAHLSDRELLAFATYAAGLAPTQEIVLDMARGTPLSDGQKRALVVWLRDQDRVQLVLKFSSARWWERVRHWRASRNLAKDIRGSQPPAA